jgi:hypothetical protein
LLLVAIGYPLSKAVDEMSRRSSIRQRVASLMKRGNGDRIVHYSLDQSARPIALRVVIVGEPAGARIMETKLRAELAALGELNAAVAVWAVPDADAVSALSARLEDVPAVLPPYPPPAAPPSLEARVRNAWPSRHGGPLLSVWTSEISPPRVRITHLGPEVGPAGLETLAKAVAIDAVPGIEEIALTSIEVAPDESADWSERLNTLLSTASEHSNLYLCVTMPARDRRRRARPADTRAHTMIGAAASRNPNIRIETGGAWRITPQLEPCSPTPPPSTTR